MIPVLFYRSSSFKKNILSLIVSKMAARVLQILKVCVEWEKSIAVICDWKLIVSPCHLLRCEYKFREYFVPTYDETRCFCRILDAQVVSWSLSQTSWLDKWWSSGSPFKFLQLRTAKIRPVTFQGSGWKRGTCVSTSYPSTAINHF